MAQCSQSAVEFIQNAFGPTVAVLCSHDAEVLAQKNNLSFVEMVRPFCKMTSEAHIRDPAGQLHTVHNMRIHLNEMNMQPPSITLARKMMNDTVGATQPPQLEGNRGNVITVGSYDLQLSASTPWFESYRENFLQLMPPSDHEFLKHNIGCMLVVSTNHPDPMDQFVKLSQQQHHIQHSAKGNSPKWLCPNIFKYFVLVHDNTEGEEEKAEAIYQSMKSTYGSHACHLLRINSRSLQAAETPAPSDAANHMPDPWSQYLNKTFDAGEVGDGDNISQPGDCVAFPDQVTEADPEHVEGQESNKLGDAVSTPDSAEAVNITDGPNDPSPEDVNMTEQENTNNEMISHPLADTNDIAVRSSERLNSFEDNDNLANSMAKLSGGMRVNSGTPPPRPKVYKPSNLAHGLCLTLSDHDRLRIFIHEFVVRGLLPYVEKMIRTLNESLARRKGLHRSLISATRIWFAGNKQADKVATNNAPDMGAKYLRESPELQMRRLGDLSFLVQMYEMAYTSYHTAKRDFNNDQAWMHFAGSLEMAAVSAFMLGSMQKAYPQEYMERSVHTYLTTCKKPSLATRAIILSSEILKARGMYAEAAMEFIRMTGEDSDLRSALFLEQAAHCFINMRRPMVRKYAFHMILAGHRYSKAAQRKHALRAYCQALQVYKGKRWSLAEDHINFTIGRQSFNLKQLENATAAFRHLLTNESRQPVSQQGAFLREYLFVFKQLLSLQSQEGQTLASLPQLPLPVIDKPATRVLLGLPQRTFQQGTKTSATALTFESIFNRSEMVQWRELEERVVMDACKYRKLPDTFRPYQQLLHGNTDNSNSPLAIVEEPMTVEIVLENPLKVSLVLTDITLLWKFVPINYETVNQENPEQQPTVLSNESDVLSGKESINRGVIEAEMITQVCLIGQQIKPLHLTITPHQTGELHILGIAYNLSAQPTTTTTTTSSTTNQIAQKDVGNKEVLDSPKMAHKRPTSFSSSVVAIQGMQDLDIQGLRLNSNKEERCSVVYGPDRRLDLVVAPPMPALEVAFTDFPSSLLCGEVSLVHVEFANRGTHALHKLLISTNNPEFFSFGTSQSPVGQSQLIKQSNDQSENSSSIYRTIPLDEKGGEYSTVKMCNVSSVIEIDIPGGGTLAPGSSLELPMWVRGPDKSGIHEINMLFYYESVEENPKIRHRTVYHTAVVHTSNSVLLTASARRAHAADMPSNKGKDLSLLVSLAVDNLNQVHDSNITEFSIEQISCASTRWAAECLGPKEPTRELKISGGESQRFCLKACQYRNPCNQDGRNSEVVFTNITFGKCAVDSAATPCCDFYFRSRHRCRTPSSLVSSSSNKSTPSTLSPMDCSTGCLQGMQRTDERWRKLALESSIAAELSLIVLWKAFVVDDDGSSHTLVGQHQVAIEALNKEATTQVFTRRPIEQQYIIFVKEPEADVKHDEPSEDVMTQLLKYTLGFPETKVHNFDKARTCVIPIQLNLYNCCATSLEVLIETAQEDDPLPVSETAPEQSPAPTDYWSSLLPPASSTNFAWVGHMSQEMSLSPQCSHQSMLWACFSKPGVFNLNSIKILARSPTTEGAVRVKLEEGQEGKVQKSGFTRQRNMSPNLVTVVESVA